MRELDFEWNGRGSRGNGRVAKSEIEIDDKDYQQQSGDNAEEESHFHLRLSTDKINFLTSYNTVVKIGLIGLGFMGASHLQAFAKIAGVEVVAVCSQDERKLSGDLSEVGGNLNHPQANYDFSAVRKYKRWQELTRDSELDAIDICLPTDMHAEVTLAALEAGRHVFCEKPMALTFADCQRMIKAAEEAKRILMIGQVLRFWPEYEYLWQFTKNENYGAVLEARFERSCGLPDWSGWLPVETRSGGATLDLLVHDIDQALHLFGLPEFVEARKEGEQDAVQAKLMYRRGLVVQIEGGWFAPGTPLSMTFCVSKEKGLLELTKQGLELSSSGGEKSAVQAPAGDGYLAEAAYFVECVEKRMKPERCLPEESAQAVQVALAIKESRSQGGKKVPCGN